MKQLEVLLVAFHYPPEISGGIPRALLFEDYLVRKNCRVRVLTPQPATRACRGGELLTAPLPGLIAAPDAASAARKPSVLRDIVRRWVVIPDAFVLWTRRATKVAIDAARERPFDLVVTSSPPESMHAIGRTFARRFGCKWLADFRDGWTFEPHRVEATLPIRAAVERRMERAVVRDANWITAATAPIADDLADRYRDRAASIHFLPSGFQRIATPDAPIDADTFHMIYTGRMNLSRDTGAPTVFFRGLERALANDTAFAKAFRLTLIGDYTDADRRAWQHQSLASHIEACDPLPYDETIRRSAEATMLLLLTPSGQRSIATRKLFDYLAVDRPVFALAEDNEAARILAETRAGFCVSSSDSIAVATGLLRAFAMWRDGTLRQHVPCDRTNRYESEARFDAVIGAQVLGDRANTNSA